MGTVEIGGRELNRLGISLIDLRAGGMWGVPANRAAAISTIRTAVELGADVIEVPVPFGPAADLFREAAVHDTFLVARLTSEVRDLDVLRHRLGRRPDMILAEELVLEHLRDWGVRLGAIIGPRAHHAIFRPISAVRGPSPALERMVDWCEGEGISYMAPSLTILGAGERTIAVPGVHSVRDVERVFAEAEVTPPAGEPG
jgi:hypothetical protein